MKPIQMEKGDDEGKCGECPYGRHGRTCPRPNGFSGGQEFQQKTGKISRAEESGR